MFSCGPLHMDEQVEGEQVEPNNLQNLCTDTGFCRADLVGVIDNRDE